MLLTVPAPDAIDQVKLGWTVSVTPNWSCAEALNCWLCAEARAPAGVGETVTVEAVWLTVTITLEVVDRPARLVTVAWNR